MAGSNIRVTIHYRTIVGRPELVYQLRQLSDHVLSTVFQHVHEQGQAEVVLAGEKYQVLRQPDQTYTLEPASNHRPLL